MPRLRCSRVLRAESLEAGAAGDAGGDRARPPRPSPPAFAAPDRLCQRIGAMAPAMTDHRQTSQGSRTRRDDPALPSHLIGLRVEHVIESSGRGELRRSAGRHRRCVSSRAWSSDTFIRPESYSFIRPHRLITFAYEDRYAKARVALRPKRSRTNSDPTSAPSTGPSSAASCPAVRLSETGAIRIPRSALAPHGQE